MILHNDSVYISTKELMLWLGRGLNTVYNWRNIIDPPIPCENWGERYFYKVESVRAWIIDERGWKDPGYPRGYSEYLEELEEEE